MTALSAVLNKELRDAVHGRWLFAFAGAFALIAFSIAVVQEQGAVGAQGFNRTTAGLINLSLLLVPLLALILGAGVVSGERDRGTLVTLRSQPLSTTSLLVGKYLGLTVAVWLAVALGFGIAGLLLALVRPVSDLAHYFLFILLAAALASTMLSLGTLISVLSEGRAKALGIAVLAWFGLVLLYDLAAIGVALSVTSSGQSLVLTALLNPVEAVRILAIMSLEPDLRVLGPMGSYLYTELGLVPSMMLLAGSVAAWAALPLAAATVVFGRQDA